eukprot:maker-scaffold_1-snap-gene-24.12-mRNA-1 protein AED:0.00 eAED:0.00 QI:142/1/1/1/1/1/2/447/391
MKLRQASTHSTQSSMSIDIPSLDNGGDPMISPSLTPVGKKRSSQSKTGLTSYKVFSEFFFVPIPGGDNETEERILTKDCYLRWLSTRKAKLLHPEGSFRRTVLAHLRGADGRKPFPEVVEISLLKKLRERDSSDRLLNPWTVCFEDHPAALEQGCRKRFTALGYHEGKRKKLHKKQSSGSYSGNSIPNAESPFFAHQAPTESMNDSFSKLVHLESENLQHKMKIAEASGVNVCLPAVSYLLNNYGTQDQRLMRDFVFPPVQECYFEQHMPVFEMNVNGVDWIVNSGDINCQHVLGDVAGKHLSTFFPSLVEFFNVARLAKEVFNGGNQFNFNKDIWIRLRATARNGQVCTFLCCFKIGNRTSIPVLGQDQTFLGRDLPGIDNSNNLPPMLV